MRSNTRPATIGSRVMAISKISLMDEDFKTAFLIGKFVVDCVEIRLTQNGTTTPIVYTSSGYLHVTPENGVEARLICLRDGAQPPSIQSQFARIGDISPGRFIPDSHYFKLEATDIAGNLWVNPVVGVKASESTKATTLTVSCDFIACRLHEAEGGSVAVEPVPAWAHMVFMEELDFPLNVLERRDTSVLGRSSIKIAPTLSAGAVGNLKVTYETRAVTPGTRHSELSAVANEKAEVPKGFQDKLLEAIRFGTATMVSCVMLETSHGGTRTVELFKSRPSNKGLIQPPLNPRTSGEAEAFFNLLDRYYRYACSAATGEELAPITKRIAGLYSLKGVWIDTTALMVSVAVEAVASDSAFAKLATPSQATKDGVDQIFEAIRNSGADASLIDRAISSMGTMKSTRAVDKLYALEAMGALAASEPKNWKGLRNPIAHGSLRIDPKALQDLLDNIYGSMTLLYKLVFILIGYDGPYSDYSQHGWHIKKFDAGAIAGMLDPVAKT